MGTNWRDLNGQAPVCHKEFNSASVNFLGFTNPFSKASKAFLILEPFILKKNTHKLDRADLALAKLLQSSEDKKVLRTISKGIVQFNLSWRLQVDSYICEDT